MNSYVRIKPDEPIVLDLGGGHKLVLVAQCSAAPKRPKSKAVLDDLNTVQIGGGAGILAVNDDPDIGVLLDQSPTLDLTDSNVLATIASTDVVTFERS